jgi:hypothetical protein
MSKVAFANWLMSKAEKATVTETSMAAEKVGAGVAAVGAWVGEPGAAVITISANAWFPLPCLTEKHF